MILFAVFRWILFSLLLMTSVGHTKTVINHIVLYPENQTLFVNVYSDIKLPEAVQEAIHNGITLVFSYEFALKKQRWYPTQPLATLTKRYHLSYNRMTGKYQLDNPVTFNRDEFNNLSAVIDAMQQLNAFPLILLSHLPKAELNLFVRFYLTAENLPSYVRVERLFSKAWEADSDWTQWPVHLNNHLKSSP